MGSEGRGCLQEIEEKKKQPSPCFLCVLRVPRSLSLSHSRKRGTFFVLPIRLTARGRGHVGCQIADVSLLSCRTVEESTHFSLDHHTTPQQASRTRY